MHFYHAGRCSQRPTERTWTLLGKFLTARLLPWGDIATFKTVKQMASRLKSHVMLIHVGIYGVYVSPLTASQQESKLRKEKSIHVAVPQQGEGYTKTTSHLRTAALAVAFVVPSGYCSLPQLLPC